MNVKISRLVEQFGLVSCVYTPARGRYDHLSALVSLFSHVLCSYVDFQDFFLTF